MDGSATTAFTPQPGDGAYLASQGQRNQRKPKPALPASEGQNGEGSTSSLAQTGSGSGGRRGRGGRRVGASRNGGGHTAAHPSVKLDPSAPTFDPAQAVAQLSLSQPEANGRSRQPRNAHQSNSRAPSANGRAPNDVHVRGDAAKEGAKRRRGKLPAKTKAGDGNMAGTDTTAEGSDLPPPATTSGRSNRRAAFEQQTKLTTPGGALTAHAPKKAEETKPRLLTSTADFVEREKSHQGGQRSAQARGNGRKKAEEKDDLVSRLTRGLGKRPFLECPICFNSILPSQPIYSCLPPTAPPTLQPTFNALTTEVSEDVPLNYYSACYTPFHLSCVRDWADRSLADETDKLRGEPTDKVAEWRCPGCQKRRAERVGGYKCFCHRLSSPPTNTSTPHSCGEPCARPRPGSKCAHPCPLICHPGPCPPCQVALIVPCPSHGSSLTVKCGASALGTRGGEAVCDEVCGKRRGCGNSEHTCQLLCHPGPCAPCTETEVVQCYCGQETRSVECGWNRDKEMECSGLPESGIETHWKGRYACERICGEKYDCGVHSCEELCHPHPLSALPCLTSPLLITHCACGQTPLSAITSAPARTKCTDPIPTCSSPCPRSRPCGHACPLPCHTGECPPCHAEVVRPCRCGESVLVIGCEELAARQRAGEGEMTCERVCKALRNCGRHECSRVCCPLSYKSKQRKKRVPMANGHDSHADAADDAHECPLTCGKLLSCCLHTCSRKDHKGACGRCLQASYDELICHCGETVIYPPVACGTSIDCMYPCARPPPSCGHPKTAHTCHESVSCPPCPYLTEKPCACGKDPAVKNIRCSQVVVSCGQVCGSLLTCGYHRCEKSCHRRTPDLAPGAPDPECAVKCTNTCGKPKRVCGHACTAACHAPARCPENEPCQAVVDQRCACGNLTQRTTCGASLAREANSSSAASREGQQLKCNSECMVKQRNARLADALGIKADSKASGGSGNDVDWAEELKVFARANLAWVKVVEGTLAGFIKGGKPNIILPHMPPAKRSFVVSLAAIYRLTTELVDVEPHRSVLVRRRVDSRIPTTSLGTAVSAGSSSSVPSKPSLGGLGNLRAPAVNAWGSKPSISALATPQVNIGLGTGSGTWARSTTNASASAPVSGGVTPSTSRPVTPQPSTSGLVDLSALAQASVPQQLQNRAVMGEVGKVEDDDWDVDA